MPFSVTKYNSPAPIIIANREDKEPPQPQAQSFTGGKKLRLLQRLKVNSLMITIITIVKFSAMTVACAAFVQEWYFAEALQYLCGTMVVVWIMFLGVVLFTKKKDTYIWVTRARYYYALTWGLTIVACLVVAGLGFSAEDRLYKIFGVVAIGTIVLQIVFLFFLMVDTFTHLLDEY